MRLADLTTFEVKELAARRRATVLVPVGSTEPHGPHLPLSTDALISEVACARAIAALAAGGSPP